MSDDEHLAYGHDQGEDALEGAERGIVSDTIKKGNAGLSSLFNKLHGAIHDIGSELTGRASEQASSAAQTLGASQTRFSSFAGLREGNDVKWYVDGVSHSLEDCPAVASEVVRLPILISYRPLICGRYPWPSKVLGNRSGYSIVRSSFSKLGDDYPDFGFLRVAQP